MLVLILCLRRLKEERLDLLQLARICIQYEICQLQSLTPMIAESLTPSFLKAALTSSLNSTTKAFS
jgi:hypothetical protein